MVSLYKLYIFKNQIFLHLTLAKIISESVTSHATNPPPLVFERSETRGGGFVAKKSKISKSLKTPFLNVLEKLIIFIFFLHFFQNFFFLKKIFRDFLCAKMILGLFFNTNSLVNASKLWFFRACGGPKFSVFMFLDKFLFEQFSYCFLCWSAACSELKFTVLCLPRSAL